MRLPSVVLCFLLIAPAALSATAPAADSVRKFDQYGDLPIGDEKARLDLFAIELQAGPDTLGYILTTRLCCTV